MYEVVKHYLFPREISIQKFVYQLKIMDAHSNHRNEDHRKKEGRQIFFDDIYIQNFKHFIVVVSFFEPFLFSNRQKFR